MHFILRLHLLDQGFSYTGWSQRPPEINAGVLHQTANLHDARYHGQSINVDVLDQSQSLVVAQCLLMLFRLLCRHTYDVPAPSLSPDTMFPFYG